MPQMPSTFRPKNMPPRGAADRAYDARRGSARERGYTTRWDKASKGYLAKHVLCLGCLALGRTTLATVTDHIVPHKGANALFWDRDNWQPCCDWHHDQVKQLLERLYASGRVDASALKLDSPAAVELSRDLAERLGK